MSGAELTDDERRRWETWKEATDLIAVRVRHEVRRATGLSPADLAVLRAIDAHARLGSVRQKTLCAATGWTQSRMSNHISRMERREVVVRDVDRDSSDLRIRMTDEGRALLERAAPAEARAVREHLLQRLEEGVHDSILAVAKALEGSPGSSAGAS